MAFLVAMWVAAAPAGAPLCWQSVAVPQPEPDGTLLAHVSLARKGDEVWLGWSAGATTVVHGQLPTLTAAPLPLGNDVRGYPSPEFVVNALGAWSLVDLDNLLTVFRWSEGAWTRHSTIPFQLLPGRKPSEMPEGKAPAVWHLNGQSVGAAGEGLVAVWQQSDSNGPRSVHGAALRDGKWVSFPTALASGLPAYSVDPMIAIAPDGVPWVAFHERDRGGLTVLKRREEKFGPVAAVPAGKDAKEIRLTMTAQGPLIVWQEPTALKTALWDGGRWKERAAPLVLTKALDFALAATDDGGAVLAWATPDAAGQHVARLAALGPAEWRVLADGVQLDPGDNHVGAIAVAASSATDVLLAFDEEGHDARVRLLRFRTCGARESPVAFGATVDPKTTWPKSVEEAATRLTRTLDEQSKVTVRNTRRDRLIQFHHGWGMGIRNGFGLWRGNQALLDSCGPKTEPDDCSMKIIERTWELLQIDGGR